MISSLTHVREGGGPMCYWGSCLSRLTSMISSLTHVHFYWGSCLSRLTSMDQLSDPCTVLLG